MVLGAGGINPAEKWRKDGTDLIAYNNGTKVAKLDANGNLKIKGEISVLQDF